MDLIIVTEEYEYVLALVFLYRRQDFRCRAIIPINQIDLNPYRNGRWRIWIKGIAAINSRNVEDDFLWHYCLSKKGLQDLVEVRETRRHGRQ